MKSHSPPIAFRPFAALAILACTASTSTAWTEPLAGQIGALKDGGGRLVTVSVDADGVGRATLVRRDAEVVSGRVLFDASARSVPEFQRPPAFEF